MQVSEDGPVYALGESISVTVSDDKVVFNITDVVDDEIKVTTLVLDGRAAKALGSKLITAAIRTTGCQDNIAIVVTTREALEDAKAMKPASELS